MATTDDPYADEDPYREDVLAALRRRVSSGETDDAMPPPAPPPVEDGETPTSPQTRFTDPSDDWSGAGQVRPDPPTPKTQFPGPSDDWGSGPVVGPGGEPGGAPGFPPPPPPVTPPPTAPSDPAVPYTQTPGSAAYQAPSAATGTDALRARLNAALLSHLGTDPYSVSADDPSIKPAIEAYYRTRERAMNTERNAAAERANAYGGGGGSVDAAQERAFQTFGQDVGTYSAQAVLGELTNRKSYLESLMKISAGLLTADQDASIRMQIAQLQAEIDRAKLAQQNEQFELELQYKLDALQA